MRTIENYEYYAYRFLQSKASSIALDSSLTGYIQAYTDYASSSGLSGSASAISCSAFRRLLACLGYDGSRFRPRHKKSVKYGVKFLTEDEIRGILLAVQDEQDTFLQFRNAAILSLFSYLGLRLSELGGLRVSDIDMRLLRISVIGKGNKQGYVPVINAVLPSLELWLSVKPDSEWLFVTRTGKKLSERMIQHLVTKYVKAVNPEFSTHTLRHSAATTLINNGVDIKTVSTLLRHSSIRVTADVYAHKTVDSVRKEMDKVIGG